MMLDPLKLFQIEFHAGKFCDFALILCLQWTKVKMELECARELKHIYIVNFFTSSAKSTGMK